VVDAELHNSLKALKSNGAPFQKTAKNINALKLLSNSKDPIGVGPPLSTVKLMVPVMMESAWAVGAAKHKAKTRQSTATIGLNRLCMEVLILTRIVLLVSHFEGHLGINTVLHNFIFLHVRLKIPNID